MNNAPLIKSERLEFWGPRIDDLDDLVALIDHDDTRQFLGPARATPTSQFERLQRNAGSWALYGYGTFAVRLPGKPDIIATCGVFHTLRGFGQGMDDVPEAGWIVRRDMWGQGIASEAMTAALAWFDTHHSPRRVTCMIEDGNTASEKVAAKLGFKAYGKHMLDDEDPLVTLTLFERLR
jgi:RimJ/RimL family protein N-acetyltransferase